MTMWLGLLAWLLLAIIPTVSRGLASVAWPAPATECAMHASAEHAMPHGKPMAAMSLDDCGYCSLLCDSPGMTGVVTLVIAPWLPMVPAMAFGRMERAGSAYQGAQSRGPPLAWSFR